MPSATVNELIINVNNRKQSLKMSSFYKEKEQIEDEKTGTERNHLSSSRENRKL